MEGSISILDRLPTEMVEEIVHHVGKSTLSNLRLSCKIMRAITELTYAKRYFSERRHIFSRHSLNQLVAITAHPVFGCHVRTIMLGNTRYSWSSFRRHSPNSSTHDLQVCRDMLDEQDDLNYGGEALELLTQAMTNIGHHRDTINIGTWTDTLRRSEHWYPYHLSFNDWRYHNWIDYQYYDFNTWVSGAGQLERFRDKKVFSHENVTCCVEYEENPEASLELLSQAAIEAGCKVDAIKLWCDIDIAIVPYHYFLLLSRRSRMRVIGVAFSFPADFQTDGRYSAELCHAMVNSLFENAINVEEITFRTACPST